MLNITYNVFVSHEAKYASDAPVDDLTTRFTPRWPKRTGYLTTPSGQTKWKNWV